MLILRIRALGILERASKLMYLKPEPGWEAKLHQSSRHSSLSGSFSGASASGSNSASPMSYSHISPSGPIDEYLRAQNYAAASGQDPLGVGKADEKKGWMRTARIRNPTAFDEVRQALMRVEEDLPPERRTNWEAWDGIVQPWHYGGYKRDVVTLVSWSTSLSRGEVAGVCSVPPLLGAVGRYRVTSNPTVESSCDPAVMLLSRTAEPRSRSRSTLFSAARGCSSSTCTRSWRRILWPSTSRAAWRSPFAWSFRNSRSARWTCSSR